jgi:two-component system, OmpR family, alkaline phosphatase synthesis response regulator PhoP
MAKTKILIVDDEAAIVNLVAAYLRPEGYDIYTAEDGPGALQAARAFAPDLIVLDVMLPGMDGIDVLTRLRRESKVYVILLTAKTEETDKIIGLSVGADDYVTKPFSPRELVARIKAAIRRLSDSKEPVIGTVMQFEHVRIDTGGRKVWVDDQEIELTQTEFDLLVSLADHRGMVLSREQLMEKAWGFDYFGDTRVVDVHIGHLRQKLGSHPVIATVRGVGYRFEDQRV